jgi:hypothetical protein
VRKRELFYVLKKKGSQRTKKVVKKERGERRRKE